MKQKLKRMINSILASAGHWRICSTAPRGRFFFDDIKPYIPAQSTIFDVGANRGQWCLEILNQIPDVDVVLCFEPMPAEFEQLLVNTRKDTRITCCPCAISSESGETLVFQGVATTTNSLKQEWEGQSSFACVRETLDELCSKLQVQSIHLLKIDTEGHDLEVLKGARQLLNDHRIVLILVEVAFRSSSRLALFDDIRSFLEGFGYQLFGVYDQQPSWDGKPGLIYANACFIKP